MKFLFFFMGIPLMIMSFFETVDVLPYASGAGVLVDGHEIELSETQQSDLQQEILKLFEDSRTMPALGVVFDEMFKEDVKNGTFVSLKFDSVFEVNGLPFDELVFRVEPTYHGISLMRGMEGKFNGRCLFVDLGEKTMQGFSDYVSSLNDTQITADVEVENGEVAEETISEEPIKNL